MDKADLFTRKDTLELLNGNHPFPEKLKFIHDTIAQRFDFINRIAVAVYDIVKITIPDNILLKPGKFSTEEFTVMKTHAWRGR